MNAQELWSARQLLRMDERPRILEILLAYRLRRPVGEGGHRSRRVVSGVLWKRRSSHHEQVGHVPALKVTVQRAGPGIGAHHGTSAKVRRLVLRDVVGAF